jgi:hypothetical protein
MPEETIVEIFMRRDRMDKEDAERLLREMRDRVSDGEDPEIVLFEDAGLEMDYIEELL